MENCLLDGTLRCINTEEACAVFQQLRCGWLQSGQACKKGLGVASSPNIQEVSQSINRQAAVPGYRIFKVHRAARLLYCVYSVELLMQIFMVALPASMSADLYCFPDFLFMSLAEH